MANVVPPKINPRNFNQKVIDKETGQLTPTWQKVIIDLQNRAQGPVSTTVPTVSASPGFPGQVAADLNFVYIFCSDNQWRRAAIALF